MNLENAYRTLTSNAPEADVQVLFSTPFLQELGYDDLERSSEYPIGRKAVDWAVRKNTDPSDVFFHTKKDPYLYMEVKGRTENLTEGHNHYLKHFAQLKQYLLAPQSKTVRWGVLMNSLDVQLFRKHGKIIHPALPCLSFKEDIPATVAAIKSQIEKPKQGLVVTVYNNKGGVGKTTTISNLAAVLSQLKKRVLVIDLDSNQGDLGDALGMAKTSGDMKSLLLGELKDIREITRSYKFSHPRLKNDYGFDVVLADQELSSTNENPGLKATITQKGKPYTLLKALELAKQEYDYIFIDAPPGWLIYSQQAVCAADVVLIPARHDNLHSLQNAGMAIARFIPAAQKALRKYGYPGPVALPVFLNNAHSITDAQVNVMHKAIARIITSNKQYGINLTPYFYSKRRPRHDSQDLAMISVPYLAYISQSDFIHIPGAFWHKTVRDQYVNLVKEYFL
ncbi:AAA family ATPase [Leptothoe sp. PORK10 BA2]|uniref:AAA family ATPase n=1 Tax=Leptothoe sp. PORK10 BA2 TaxID=3110254 RepID=UPI002B20ECA5|nr:AAA family ATPase [Leptothoe sp. PORK10 BA2]MEA5464521.1 AAA family ATPase [Leptothoe sp. PORK10 BA2]